MFNLKAILFYKTLTCSIFDYILKLKNNKLKYLMNFIKDSKQITNSHISKNEHLLSCAKINITFN